jgi:hypothetical protein
MVLVLPLHGGAEPVFGDSSVLNAGGRSCLAVNFAPGSDSLLFSVVDDASDSVRVFALDAAGNATRVPGVHNVALPGAGTDLLCLPDLQRDKVDNTALYFSRCVWAGEKERKKERKKRLAMHVQLTPAYRLAPQMQQGRSGAREGRESGGSRSCSNGSRSGDRDRGTQQASFDGPRITNRLQYLSV